MQAAREPLHGQVSVATPPGARMAALVSLLALVSLGAAAYIVEVPQRTRAVGVLMPPQGFMKIVAAEAGQVIAVHVGEGVRVAAGEPLLAISSDRGVIGRGSVSASQLLSLQNERRLAERANRERRRIQQERIRAVEDQLETVNLRLKFLNEEIDIQRARGALLQSRFDRLRQLASNGNVATVQLEEETLALLQARAGMAVLQQQATQVIEERAGLLRTRTTFADEADLQRIEFAVADEQLQRQIAAHEGVVGRELLVTARAGQFVHSGQTLMTLAHEEVDLQAWLYLPSASAGMLRVGQEVQLRLDAYPHQMFGTQPATVSAISTIALLPSELDVPLALGGPVFEVRATLDGQYVTARGLEWPLVAGISFQADIVQHRFRLYEWLLRLGRGNRRSSRPADA
jgi:membrane fusion protein